MDENLTLEGVHDNDQPDMAPMHASQREVRVPNPVLEMAVEIIKRASVCFARENVQSAVC